MDPYPTREAERHLKEWGISTLPVEPLAIANSHDIECRGMPASATGVSGMLISTNGNFGILYATHIESPGFQRFSIAHELGHYFLPQDPERVFTEGIHQSTSGFVSDDKYEIEADQFACGLLMPTYLFDPALDKAGEGMDAVKQLAESCGTSLTATAIRYAQRCAEPTAIVISSGGTIEYCFMSDELKQYPGVTWIRKGTPVPGGTKTKLFTPDRIRNKEEDEGESDLATWFRCNAGGEIYEEVIGLGQYGKALTVLSCPDLPDPEDIEEEEELEDSWEVRFR